MDDWGEVEVILLEAAEERWTGLRPSLIDGEENPTLELVAGREYDLAFENGDGDELTVAVWDDESVQVGTGTAAEEGEQRVLSVEAGQAVDTYRCAVHPEEMVGDADVRGA